MVSEAWRQEYNTGHYRLATELLQPITDSDDAESLLALGTMYLYGMHFFDSEADYIRFMQCTPADQQRTFWETTEETRLRGLLLLEQASQKGSWVASQNLATYYSGIVKQLPEQERLTKARYYYDLVDQQRTT